MQLPAIDWGNYTHVITIANVYRHSAGIAMTIELSPQICIACRQSGIIALFE